MEFPQWTGRSRAESARQRCCSIARSGNGVANGCTARHRREAISADAATVDTSRRARFDEVPSVSIPVGEHGHRAVCLVPRLLLELDTPAHVVPVVAPEIVRRQEEEHAPTRLAPDRGTLAFPIRLGKKQRRASPGRHQDPSLAFRKRRVLDEREAERADEIVDRLLAVPRFSSPRTPRLGSPARCCP